MRHLAHIRSENSAPSDNTFCEKFKIHIRKDMEDLAHYRWSRVFGLAQAAELLRHSTHRKSCQKGSSTASVLAAVLAAQARVGAGGGGYCRRQLRTSGLMTGGTMSQEAAPGLGFRDAEQDVDGVSSKPF